MSDSINASLILAESGQPGNHATHALGRDIAGCDPASTAPDRRSCLTQFCRAAQCFSVNTQPGMMLTLTWMRQSRPTSPFAPGRGFRRCWRQIPFPGISRHPSPDGCSWGENASRFTIT